MSLVWAQLQGYEMVGEQLNKSTLIDVKSEAI